MIGIIETAGSLARQRLDPHRKTLRGVRFGRNRTHANFRLEPQSRLYLQRARSHEVCAAKG
jgi:hypothetical protein